MPAAVFVYSLVKEQLFFEGGFSLGYGVFCAEMSIIYHLQKKKFLGTFQKGWGNNDKNPNIPVAA